MARRIPRAEAQRVDSTDDEHAVAPAKVRSSNGDTTASAGSADVASQLALGAPASVLIPGEQYRRIVNSSKTRPDLLFDVALALEGRADEATVEQVLGMYKLLPEDLPVLLDNPVTGMQIKELRTDIRENGLGFRRKSAAMAEAFLPMVATILNDEDTPPHVKLQGVSSLAKWGGLEKSALDANAGGVTVQINFPASDVPVKVISGDSK